MNKVAIFIPTFHRPNAIARVADNIRENTPEGTYRVYFVVEAQDTDSYERALLYGTPIINEKGPCYAEAINSAYERTTEPYFFCGADDIGFHKGWLDQALSHMKDGIQVVGTNDLGSIPIGEQRDATHYLVDRTYIVLQSGVIDRPNTVLYPYDHNWTDKEFCETAKSRGVYDYCPESKVQHFHPAWNKAKMDETYQRGYRHERQDMQVFQSRQHLWTK